MADQEKVEKVLPQSVVAHANRMAAIISLIEKMTASSEEAEEWYIAYIRQVLRRLIELGRKPDAAIELVLATYRPALDQIEKVIQEHAAAKEAAADAKRNAATQEAFQRAIEGLPLGEEDESALGI